MKTFTGLTQNEQIELFAKVKELKKNGLGYKKIRKKLIAEEEVRLSNGTMFYWFNNKVKLLGGKNYFKEKPSPELSYVLGVMYGDGSIAFESKKKDYKLSLHVKDKDFIEKFSDCCATILKKEKSSAICKQKHQMFSTQVRSKQLYYFIKSVKEDFEKAKPFIEEFPAEFIRGLADSEGSATSSPGNKFATVVIVAVSVNLPLLQYVQELLQRKFFIGSNLRKTHLAGMQDSVINGRIITRTKDVYRLSINKLGSIVEFSDSINFTIVRKKLKLLDAIFLIKNFGRKNASLLWKKLYHKEKKFWIRNNIVNVNEMNFVD